MAPINYGPIDGGDASTTAEGSFGGGGGALPHQDTEPTALGQTDETGFFDGVGEAATQAIGGAFDGLDSMFNVAYDLDLVDTEFDIFPNIDRLVSQSDIDNEQDVDKKADLEREFAGQSLNAGASSFIRGAAQFGVGAVPGLGFLKAARGAATGLKAYKAAKLLSKGAEGSTIVRGATWGAAADFLAFDGNEGRVTDILAENAEEHPWMNAFVIDSLKSGGTLTEEKDKKGFKTGRWVYEGEGADSNIKGRVKNVVEGAIMGITIDALGVAIKNLRGTGKAISKAAENGNSIHDIAPAKSANSNLTSIGADLDALNRYEAALGTNISDPAALAKGVEELRLVNPELADRVASDSRAVQSLKRELFEEVNILSDEWVTLRTSPTSAKLTDETWDSMDEVAKQHLSPEQSARIKEHKLVPRAAREKALLASAESKADKNRFEALLAKDKLQVDALVAGFGTKSAPKGLRAIDDEAFKAYSNAVESGDFVQLVGILKEGGNIPMVKAPQLRGGTVEEFLAAADGSMTITDAGLLKATRAAGIGDGAALKAGTGLTEADVAARQALTNEKAGLKTKRAPKGASAAQKATVKSENAAITARKKSIDKELADTETLAVGQRKAGDNSLTDAEILKRAATERAALKKGTAASTQRWADFMEGKVDLAEAPHMLATARQTKAAIDASLVKYSIDQNNLGQLPIEALAEFQELLRLSGRLHDAINGTASRAGGLLRSVRTTPKASGVAGEAWIRNLKQAESFTNSTSGHELASKQMAAILGATDDMLGKVISDQTKPGFKEYALHYWTNSLLSGLQTLSIQPISAAFMTFAMPFEAAIGSALRGDLKASGRKLKGLYGIVQSFRSVPKAIAGLADNVEQAVQPRNGTQVLDNALQALKSGQGQLDSRTLLDEGSRALGSGNLSLNGSSMDKLTQALETTVGLPSRLIATADEFSKGLNYNVKLMTDGYDIAARSGIADSTEAATAHMNKVANWDQIEDPIERVTFRNYHDEAVEYARSATFQTEAKEGGWTQSVQGWNARHPMARIVMPFVRTPSNIIKYAWERTPILARLSNADNAILKSTNPADAAAAQAIRDRRRVGTAMWATSLALASEGQITGGAPREPGARAAWKEAGIQEYSIALGSHKNSDGDTITDWYSFKRTDPFGMFLGVSADLATLFQELDSEDASVAELTAAASTAMIENIKSRSYLQGVAQLLQAIQDPKRHAEPYIGSQVQNVIPNFFAQVQRYGPLGGLDEEGEYRTDPMREVNSIYDRMRNRIPGVASALHPKLNIFGEHMYNNTGTGVALDLVNPFFHVKSEFGPEQVKALRKGQLDLSQIKGKKDRVSAAALMVDFKWNMKTRYAEIDGVELTPDQRNRWVTLASKDLEKDLADLIDSPTWKYLSDPQPGDEDQSGKYIVFKRIIESRRTRAKAALIYENEDLQSKLKQRRLERTQSRDYTRPDSVLAGER